MAEGKKVIVVADDEKIVLEALETLLSPGYTVCGVDNGADALEKVNELNPDLVILDIVMPQMDGIEVCRKIKANKATAFIPVMILTAKARLDNTLSSFNSGADAFMTKPYITSVLLDKITHLIRRSEIKKRMN